MTKRSFDSQAMTVAAINEYLQARRAVSDLLERREIPAFVHERPALDAKIASYVNSGLDKREHLSTYTCVEALKQGRKSNATPWYRGVAIYLDDMSRAQLDALDRFVLQIERVVTEIEA